MTDVTAAEIAAIRLEFAEGYYHRVSTLLRAIDERDQRPRDATTALEDMADPLPMRGDLALRKMAAEALAALRGTAAAG